MRGLLALSRGIDRITTFIGQQVSWLILAAILISVVNAISRKFFGWSSNLWLEMQWYLFGGAFMGAAAYTLLKNEHIRIDLIYARWSRRTQNWIDLLGHLFFLMPFVALTIYFLWPWFFSSWRTGEGSSSAGGLPLWPARLIILTGFILLFLQGISEIIKRGAIMAGVIPDPVPYVSQHDAVELEAEAIAADMSNVFMPQKDNSKPKDRP